MRSFRLFDYEAEDGIQKTLMVEEDTFLDGDVTDFMVPGTYVEGSTRDLGTVYVEGANVDYMGDQYDEG